VGDALSCVVHKSTGFGADGGRELLRVNPGYSIEQRRKVPPYKNRADFERFVEGLRKAGLPEE